MNFAMNGFPLKALLSTMIAVLGHMTEDLQPVNLNTDKSKEA